jgi:hypothetical protein
MTLTPDQYDEMAKRFEEAAGDPLVRAEGREEFAKKAQWFHFLAQRRREVHRDNGHPTHQGNAVNLDSLPKQKGSLAPFLATLWISGAVLYFVSTFMFANAINLTGKSDAQSPHEGPPLRRLAWRFQPSFILREKSLSINFVTDISRDSNKSAEQHQSNRVHIKEKLTSSRRTGHESACAGTKWQHAIALNQPYEAPKSRHLLAAARKQFTSCPRDPVTEREVSSQSAG